ncbi:hypothetical protein, partial [Rhodococcus sp. WS1]|uniref:hypothetical protein n=1 Tax=Rhodococcus sp. WS1 TaxID=1882743 RepID=UPI001C9DFD0E
RRQRFRSDPQSFQLHFRRRIASHQPRRSPQRFASGGGASRFAPRQGAAARLAVGRVPLPPIESLRSSEFRILVLTN